MTEPDPQMIAGYTLAGVVGVGGMGKVYIAQHPRLPRQDALKVLSPEFSGDPVFRARFERESQLAASLDHPNIVPVYDCGSDDGRLWLSMRLVNGDTSLDRLQKSPGGLSVQQVVDICRPVAAALDFAHTRKLLHRDVKPANILIDASTGVEHVLLTDFGIAQVDGDPSLTSAGMVIGTVDYCSPEHIESKPTDGRSDQYSLACTAAHLLTGKKPFGAERAHAVMIRHLHPDRPRISSLRADLPAAIDAVFTKAFSIDPAGRFASCAEFVDALAAAGAERPPQPAPSPRPVPSPQPTPAQPPRPAAPPYVQTVQRPLPGGGQTVRGNPFAPPAGSPTVAQPSLQQPHYAVPGPGHPSPHPGPPGRPPQPPQGAGGSKWWLIAAAVLLVVVLAGVTAVVLTRGDSTDDRTRTAAESSDTPASAAASSAPPLSTRSRQTFDAVDPARRAIDPCRIPAALLSGGGMQPTMKPLAFDPEIVLCDGELTGNEPTVVMGGYVAGSRTADWVISQYNRGVPAFEDLPGWRRYDATDRERPTTRCKYGFVSEGSPRYAFEVTIVRSPAGGGFDSGRRAAACNRLANVARAIDPAMPHS